MKTYYHEYAHQNHAQYIRDNISAKLSKLNLQNWDHGLRTFLDMLVAACITARSI
jgi:hypothetical protein